MCATSLPATGRTDARIALAITALWIAATLALYARHWGEDLSALFMAGHLWATGRPELIYAAPETFMGGTPPEWLPEVARLGMAGHTF